MRNGLKAKKQDMQLLDNRLMVRPAKTERVTAGGIIIPETNKAEVLGIGEVVMVGATEETKAGDYVLYLKNTGSKIDWNGEVVQVVFEGDVVAVVEDPKILQL